MNRLSFWRTITLTLGPAVQSSSHCPWSSERNYGFRLPIQIHNGLRLLPVTSTFQFRSRPQKRRLD